MTSAGAGPQPLLQQVQDHHFDRLVEVAGKTFEHSRADLEAWRSGAPAVFRVATVDDAPVGFVWAALDSRGGQVTECGMWVEPAHRRAGIGSMLLADFERVFFVDLQGPDLVFDCPPSLAGEALLVKHGYRIQGLDLTLPYGGDGEPPRVPREPSASWPKDGAVDIRYWLDEPDEGLAEELAAWYTGLSTTHEHHENSSRHWCVAVHLPLTRGDHSPPRIAEAAPVSDGRIVLRHWLNEYDGDLRDALVDYYQSPRAVWNVHRPNWHLRIPTPEAMAFLKDIESGAVTLDPEWPPDGAAGNVPYRASNGWHITIFNDVNEWDYIDEIRTNDGRFLTDMHIDAIPELKDYDPDPEVAWKRYGIPGYKQSACLKCGTRRGPGRRFVCPECS